VRFPRAGRAWLLALSLFAFDLAVYGTATAGFYVLKRAGHFDIVKGADMVPDEAAKHALMSMSHWMLGAARMMGLGPG
jgi:hypothetical protein